MESHCSRASPSRGTRWTILEDSPSPKLELIESGWKILRDRARELGRRRPFYRRRGLHRPLAGTPSRWCPLVTLPVANRWMRL